MAYIQDRLIGENIRMVKDLIDLTECYNIQGILLLVDFQKAFDCLNWNFLEYALNEFGFGNKFVALVKMLYKNIVSSVINNGHTTDHFYPSKGIRQGCPVSAYLFVICVELLAIKIRENLYIIGLEINQHVYKILQFADDTVLIANNMSEIKKYLDVLYQFGTCSGLKINKSKSELFMLGEKHHKTMSLTV